MEHQARNTGQSEPWMRRDGRKSRQTDVRNRILPFSDIFCDRGVNGEGPLVLKYHTMKSHRKRWNKTPRILDFGSKLR
jgi:hypothetical protein